MVTWAEFERAEPEMAAAGRSLIYQFGPGLGYLATVRADGAPRLHPICPAIVDGALYAFIIDSPKRRDLLRDGRYALHTFSPQDTDDVFMLSGRAEVLDDSALYERVAAVVDASGVTREHDELLFTFSIERAFHAKYAARGTTGGPPAKTHWAAAQRVSGRRG
jgi:hypothetical protein